MIECCPRCWRPKDRPGAQTCDRPHGKHVRSYDPDGEPLHYCATCYQDWPCPAETGRYQSFDPTNKGEP